MKFSKVNSSYIDALATQIRSANNAYYNAQPVISDAQYDAIKDELRELEPKHPALFEVGAPASGIWEDRKHNIPMTSLNKVNTIPELEEWATRTKVNDFCIQEKLDGISVSLDYENGRLVAGVTRGDGIIGENITPNVLLMQGIMKEIPGFNGSIRGEIILFKSAWKEHFSEYANPRNTASGLARRQSGGGQEHLIVMCYDVVSDNLSFTTESQKLEWLSKNNFKIANYYHGPLSDIEKIYNEYESGKRDALDYEIDGLVIKVNSLNVQKSLGTHGTSDNANPKGQIALKFAHEMRMAVIKDIVWETGKTGRVTPVAHIEPVRIGGVTVKRASLHNADNIRRLKVCPGSEVLVSRRNDVIPYVEEVLSNSGEYNQFPSICPTCDAQIEVKGKYIQCPNHFCPSRMTGSVEKWVKNLEIDGWGPKVIEALHSTGKLQYISDLYALSHDDISSLEGHGPRSAEVLLGNLHSKKDIPLHIALGSLNIPGCGRRVFQTIVKAGHKTLEHILRLTPVQLERIEGVGPVLALSVYHGLQSCHHIIDSLLHHGIHILDVAEPSANILQGKSFCCTGTMSRPRKEIIDIIESNGGEWKSSVGAGLDFLIIDDPSSPTSKAQKARKMGVKLISEQEFNSMLKS